VIGIRSLVREAQGAASGPRPNDKIGTERSIAGTVLQSQAPSARSGDHHGPIPSARSLGLRTPCTGGKIGPEAPFPTE